MRNLECVATVTHSSFHVTNSKFQVPHSKLREAA